MDGSPGMPGPGTAQNWALILYKSGLCGVCGVVENVLHSLSAFKHRICGECGESEGFFLNKSGKWRTLLPPTRYP